MPLLAEHPPATSPAVAPSRQLRAKLHALRRKHVSVAVLAGLALSMAVAIEMLAVAMFLDWWLDLPRAVRLIFLVFQGSVLAHLLFRQVLLPLIQRPGEDALALMVEKARPEFNSRLISSVQFTRPGGIPSGAATPLVSLTVADTEAMAAPLDFNAIVPTDRMKILALMALTVGLLGVGGLYYGRDVCFDLLKRAFLSNIPVPRKTRVYVPNGDKVIGRGDDVRLDAFAEGIVPADGRVDVQYPNRRKQEFSLEQNKDDVGHFGRTIENVQDSFTYVIYLNDGMSGTHTVKAIPRPTVATIACLQVFPSYTGLPSQRRPLGDLTLLAGSRLQLQITATKDIQRAALRLVGPEREVPLTVDPSAPRQLHGEIMIPAKGMTGFSVLMLDTEGMESRDSAVYRVEIVPDKTPVVRITKPDRKEELVTRSGTLRIGMSITDDFAIAGVSLHYKVMTDTNVTPEAAVELDLGDRQPKSMDNYGYLWKLDTFAPPLTEGSVLEFWLEAKDNNDTTGPGIGQSGHQLARIVSAEEKLADAWNRASDFLSGIEDVAEDQQKANQNLGTILLEKSKPE